MRVSREFFFRVFGVFEIVLWYNVWMFLFFLRFVV